MRRHAYTAVWLPLLFVFSPSGAAQQSASPKIASLQITGHSVFTTRQILDFLSSQAGLTYSRTILDADLGLLTEHYRRRGYLDARPQLVSEAYTADSTSVDLVIDVEEGRLTLVGTVRLVGQTDGGASDVLRQFDTRPGSVLHETVLENDIAIVLDMYERQGYPFARCMIESLERRPGEESDSLDIILRVEEGDLVRIEEIRVEGNAETDNSVIVRETRLSVGEAYNPAKVDAIRQRLRRLNIFSEVGEPVLYRRNDRHGLLIKVQEGSTNTFDGILGYIPGTGVNEKGYLTGLVSISMRNVLGTGRKASFRWQRDDRHSQELGIRYLEPWVFDFPINIGGGFFQRQQDSSYVRRVIDAKTELMISEELSAGILFGAESVIPSSGVSPSRVFRSATTTAGVELLYDTRDDVYSPTGGARYRTDYSYGEKRIRNVPQELLSQIPRRASVQRFTLDLDFFLSTFPRQVVAAGFHGRELRSGHPEEGEMFRLGGTNTLRGYRENQFLGSRVGWSNLEYRVLLAHRSFLYGFVDTGYYSRPGNDTRGIPASDAFKVGYGIGVQLETALGNVGVSYALGQGDSFTTGKIHFGLFNDF